MIIIHVINILVAFGLLNFQLDIVVLNLMYGKLSKIEYSSSECAKTNTQHIWRLHWIFIT